MGNSLNSPEMDFYTSSLIISSGKFVGASVQGYRKNMEDRILLTPLKYLDYYILAVFDGHGGEITADYLLANIKDYFNSSEDFKSYVNNKNKTDDLLKISINDIFHKIDRDLYKFIKGMYNRRVGYPGSTATMVLITPEKYVIINTGDSRSFISSFSGEHISSKDHKPNLELERKRIINGGGFVHMDRVNGELAVSRAFGDFQFKNNQNEKDLVIPTPDIHIETKDEKKWIFLASDGIYDIFNNDKLVSNIDEIYLNSERLLLQDRVIERYNKKVKILNDKFMEEEKERIPVRKFVVYPYEMKTKPVFVDQDYMNNLDKEISNNISIDEEEISEFFSDEINKLTYVSKKIIKRAISLGSKDNISIIIGKLF